MKTKQKFMAFYGFLWLFMAFTFSNINAQTPPTSMCDPSICSDGTQATGQYVVEDIAIPGYEVWQCPIRVHYWIWRCADEVRISNVSFYPSDYTSEGCAQFIENLLLRDADGNCVGINVDIYNETIRNIGDYIGLREFEKVQSTTPCPSVFSYTFYRPVCEKNCFALAYKKVGLFYRVIWYDVQSIECYSSPGCCITKSEYCYSNGNINVTKSTMITASCDSRDYNYTDCFTTKEPPTGYSHWLFWRSECTPNCN